MKKHANPFTCNYYALALSILKGYSPERALETIETGRDKSSDADVEHLIEMKKTMSYSQLAKLRGKRADVIARKISLYQKQEVAGKVCGTR